MKLIAKSPSLQTFPQKNFSKIHSLTLSPYAAICETVRAEYIEVFFEFFFFFFFGLVRIASLFQLIAPCA